MAADADRNLLFALLALQNGLVDQSQFLAAFHAWTCDKGRPIADVLIARGDLDANGRDLIGGLVDLHLQRHGGDAGESLATVARIASQRTDFGPIGEAVPDLRASLAALADTAPEAGDEYATRLGSLGLDGTRGDGPPAPGPLFGVADDLRFRRLRLHATGGLGAVFVARDEQFSRDVALKQIRDEFSGDAESRRRFLAEAEITGRLEHPGIVPVYGLGRDPDGRPYYAMRLIRGHSLRDAIARYHRQGDDPTGGPLRGSLRWRDLLGRFVAACNAVAYAHDRGVVHRDLKPANIMLGPFGETLVVDWGLAKVVGREGAAPDLAEAILRPSASDTADATQAGSVIGTPAYMSPEQAGGETARVGPASDVYSLGATLYCLLTGRAPLEDSDVPTALLRAKRGEFMPPRAVTPAVPTALEAVCLRAMALRPEDRYPSAKALAEDVERWLAGEPVSARREPWPDRARRCLGRHRTGLAAAVAASAAAVLGLATVLAVQSKANADLRSGNERLRAAIARETRVKDLALAAIRRSYSGAAADPLLKEARLIGLRRSLFGAALDFYQQLGVVLKDGQDERTQAELADAYASVGAITSEMGSNSQSLKAYEQALAIREALVRAHPGVPAYRAALAATLNDVGTGQNDEGRREEALRTYRRAREIGEAQGTDDAASRRELARTYQLTAHILTASRQSAEMLELDEKARTILEDLVRSDPSDVASRRELGLVLNDIGALLEELGRLQDAVRSLEAVSVVLGPLTASEPPDVRAQVTVALSYLNLATWYQNVGRADEGVAACRRAAGIFGRLGASDPALVRAQVGLIGSLVNEGNSQRQLGRTGEAISSYRRALEVIEAWRAADPDQTRYRRWRCTAHDAIGRTSEQMGRLDEALDAFRRARADAAALAADPQSSIRQLGMVWLADVYESIVRVLRRAGHPDGSLEFARKALDVRQGLAADLDADPQRDPFSAAMNTTRMGDLQRGLGQPSEAARSFRKARSYYRGKLGGADLYNLACLESLTSALAGDVGRLTPPERADVAGAADRAVDLVRRAIVAGYRDLVTMDADTDLDPIRSRPDFQSLMRDLAFPADPFARGD
jgi:serine/threonine-protein kinase